MLFFATCTNIVGYDPTVIAVLSNTVLALEKSGEVNEYLVDLIKGK